MKKLILSGAVLLGTLSLQAQDHPLWMRYCALSPDGKTIAFTYQGDIFTVPVQEERPVSSPRMPLTTVIRYGALTASTLPLPPTVWEVWTSLS